MAVAFMVACGGLAPAAVGVARTEGAAVSSRPATETMKSDDVPRIAERDEARWGRDEADDGGGSDREAAARSIRYQRIAAQ